MSSTDKMRDLSEYDEQKLLDELIESHGLSNRREAIYQVAKRAILLRTIAPTTAEIPLGATKLGGNPDLPVGSSWPVHSSGKSLAFLAQINLAEIAQCGTVIDGLPNQGLLSLFSVWGWVSDGDLDPQTPPGSWSEQDGWSVVLHSAVGEKLTQQSTPPDVNSFPSATVEPILILSLPNHRREPALAILDWSKQEYRTFDEMQMIYRSTQMGHLLNSKDSLTSHHLLGGYAMFQQEFPEELLDKDLAMLLQIGSDNHTQMCWGDGGELTFYADADGLRNGRFERLWGTCQCG